MEEDPEKNKMETCVSMAQSRKCVGYIATVWVDKENSDGSKKKDKYVGGSVQIRDVHSEQNEVCHCAQKGQE